MKFLKIILILFVSLTILFGKCLASEQSDLSFPAFPMAFWGEVKINGNSAPVGTIIRAYYGSFLGGEVVVRENGVYGYLESTKQKLIVGKGDGLITFKFQSSNFNNGIETAGNDPQTYPGFTSGVSIRKDLNFLISSGNGRGSNGGEGGGSVSGSSRSGGGGGGSPSFIVKKGDINGDKKVDKYDFSLMMANWGKTGINSCDLNNDRKVDKYDFALLMLNWSI